MLRIYEDAIALCREAAVVAKAVERFDGDLARQLRRAATSVPLNIAEGSGAFGGNRRQRYYSAMGSAREVGACFDAAEAMGYVAVAVEREANGSTSSSARSCASFSSDDELSARACGR